MASCMKGAPSDVKSLVKWICKEHVSSSLEDETALEGVSFLPIKDHDAAAFRSSSWRKGVESLILICGSFYLVAEILEAMGISNFDPTVGISKLNEEEDAALTTDSENSDWALWHFQYQPPRIFTTPRLCSFPLPDDVSIFFLRREHPHLLNALNAQPESVWYQIDRAEALNFPANQRVDLVDSSWENTMHKIIEIASELNAASPSHVLCDDPGSSFVSAQSTRQEAVSVYIQDSEATVMRGFMFLVVNGSGSLTGSKRKYVEVEMDCNKFCTHAAGSRKDHAARVQ
eukprot:Gregarina_sp_Poly_1__2244@NODE_15_length_23029_cov_81_474305_g13_i0_p10_GENE_NODE_15_length_23029_cov_81_474305_g13_i0NODE_15_length_23029_cov_81_474305_g13_i0_p10_ORF_typecomplete_len287_score43_63PAD_porph/PF04371_15/0_1_NODE_15_length_23029_cov_81_474305_g13_i073338193